MSANDLRKHDPNKRNNAKKQYEDSKKPNKHGRYTLPLSTSTRLVWSAKAGLKLVIPIPADHKGLYQVAIPIYNTKGKGCVIVPCTGWERQVEKLYHQSVKERHPAWVDHYMMVSKHKLTARQVNTKSGLGYDRIDYYRQILTLLCRVIHPHMSSHPCAVIPSFDYIPKQPRAKMFNMTSFFQLKRKAPPANDDDDSKLEECPDSRPETAGLCVDESDDEKLALPPPQC